MDFVSQILSARIHALGPLRGRKKIAGVIIGLCAFMAFATLSNLFHAEGTYASYLKQADPSRAVILSSNASSEASSAIPRAAISRMLKMPGVRLADVEITYPLHCCMYRQFDHGPAEGAVLHGWGLNGFALHPGFKLVAGRMPLPGARELIAGRMAHDGLLHLNPGDDLRLPDGWWTIVGVFSTRTALEGDLIVDRDLLFPGLLRDTYSSVLAQLQSPQSFETLKAALAADHSLSVKLLHQSDYLASQYVSANVIAGLPLMTSARQMLLFYITLFFVAMVWGQTFFVMGAGVQDRAHEIVMLHIIGFDPIAIALSFVLEAMAFAVIGTCIGGILAWLQLEGVAHADLTYIKFEPAFTLPALAYGLITTLISAIGGALVPARSAARLLLIEKVFRKPILGV